MYYEIYAKSEKNNKLIINLEKIAELLNYRKDNLKHILIKKINLYIDNIDYNIKHILNTKSRAQH